MQDVARGYSECQSAFQSLLGHVYNLVKSNKQNRRAFLKSLLRHFDEYEVQISVSWFNHKDTL